VIGFIVFLLLISINANAAQPGRITSEVNFRKGPSTSEPVISRLRADEEVEVIKLNPSGWYFVTYRGRPGFIHKNYLKIDQQKHSNAAMEPRRHQLAKRAGMILAGLGILLMASVLVPELPPTATALCAAMVTVVVFDLWFQLGMLYSFFFASLGALLIFLLFRRSKNSPTGSTDQILQRKAA
jgi:hypothetical protein